MFIILEFMDGKELTEIFEAYHKYYSDDFIKYTLYCSARGLFDMHEKGIMHRDIKSDNIFCNSDGEVKIADLGIGVCLTKDQAYRKTKIGTTQWIAPEILNAKIYSKAVDVYSFGCFMYESSEGKPPFSNFSNQESLFEAVSNAEFTRHFKCSRRSDEFNDLLLKCTIKEEHQRYTMAQVLEHPYLQGAGALKTKWLEDFNNYRQYIKKNPKKN